MQNGNIKLTYTDALPACEKKYKDKILTLNNKNTHSF